MSEIGKRPDSKQSIVPTQSSRQGVRRVPMRMVGPRPPHDDGLKPQLVLFALRRWWKVAFPTGLVLAVVAAVVVFQLFEKQYKATAWIQIQSQTPYLAFAPERADIKDHFVGTQLELLRSPMVMEPAVTRLNGHNVPELESEPDPVERLTKDIKIESRGKSSDLYTVSFTSTSPQAATDVANAVADSYFDLRGTFTKERNTELVSLLEEERQTRQQELTELEETFATLSGQTIDSETGMFSAPWDNRVTDPLAGYRDQVASAEAEKAVLDAQVTVLENALSSPALEVASELVDLQVENDPGVLDLKQQILAAERALHDVQSKASADSGGGYAKMYEDKMQLLQTQLESYRLDVRKRVAAAMEIEERLKRRHELDTARAQAASAQIRYKTLDDRYRKALRSMQSGNQSLAELRFRQDELVRKQDVLGRISSRVVALRTEQQAPKRVNIWRRATVPAEPQEIFPLKQLVMAVPGAFLFPFFLAVLWERILRRVYDSDRLERDLDLAVVAEIARLPRRTLGKTIEADGRLDEALQIFEESVDTLGTSLTLSEELKNARVLAVTSAVNNEGKTSIAAQLAVSISRTTHSRTLLIDGDMRSPDIHKKFDLALEPGFADVLAGNCNPADAIVTTWSEDLDILPAGRLRMNPHRLVGNGCLKSFLGGLGDEYRYIVIDTPPILAAGESMVLSKAADATLLCAMWDVSRAEQLHRACKCLFAAGIQPAGTVLSGVPTRQYLRRYGHYEYVQR